MHARAVSPSALVTRRISPTKGRVANRSSTRTIVLRLSSHAESASPVHNAYVRESPAATRSVRARAASHARAHAASDTSA